MKFPGRFTLILSLSALFSGCGFFDSGEVTVPSYVFVPSMQFQSEADGSQGDSIQDFQDVWVSTTGALLGTIGMPALLPVQRTGPTQIELEAGVVRSGQYNERVKYPFVKPEIYIRNLQPGVADTFRPVFRYLANTKFRFIEDYDRPGTYFEPFIYNENVKDTIVRVNDNHALIPGKSSGKVVMAATSSTYAVWTSGSYELAGYNSPVYLELDYNTNINVQLNMYYDDPVNPGNRITTGSLTLIPTDKGVNRGWNKVYFDLSKEVIANTRYYVFIGMLNPNHIVPEVYLDNIKLVTF